MRHMLYPAPGLAVGPPPEGFEEVWIEAAELGRTHGWLRRMRSPPERSAVLFFHGNGENLESLRRDGTIDRLGALDAVVLVVDYPGYGRSAGTPSEESLVTAGIAAFDRLGELAPDRPRVVCGWSLGAATAAQVAAARPEAVAGLVLMSPWSRLADVARRHFPPLLVRFLLAERWDSTAAVARYRGAALVLHGARDEIIPVEQGREVAAGLPGARWVELPRAGHNDLLAHDEPWRELAGFLRGAAILAIPQENPRS
jgi:hypothetical protein